MDVPVQLDEDAALVLFELLSARGRLDASVLALSTSDAAALNDLLCALERALVQPFKPEYQSLLAAARASLLRRYSEPS